MTQFTQVAVEPGVIPREAKTYIAGRRGLVGSALWRKFSRVGFSSLVGPSSSELDLTDRGQVFEFFAAERPDVVILAAARVGGIHANATRPVDFISENLRIQTNVLDAALEFNVGRLLFLGSSCIYPKLAPQPISEDDLLTGKLEPTNDAYAIAKIAGLIHVKSVRAQYGLPWISAMPTNLYGPGDNFSESDSHVLAALIRRYVEAADNAVPKVTNWGTGTPRREFLHVDDLASACLHILETYNGDSHVNVGTGADITIAELSDIVRRAAGYEGAVEWDTTKPDGTPRKLLDTSLLAGLGWTPDIGLAEGITSTVEWFRKNASTIRR